jgi:hypothetical protein
MTASSQAMDCLRFKASAQRTAAALPCREARSKAHSKQAAVELGEDPQTFSLPGSRGHGSAKYAEGQAQTKVRQLKRRAKGVLSAQADLDSDLGFLYTFGHGGSRLQGEVGEQIIARTLKNGDGVWCRRSILLGLGLHQSLTYVETIERVGGKPRGFLVRLGNGTQFHTSEVLLEEVLVPVDIPDQMLLLCSGVVPGDVAVMWVSRLVKNLGTMKFLCGRCFTAQKGSTCIPLTTSDGSPDLYLGFQRWKCSRCFQGKRKGTAVPVEEQKGLQARAALAPTSADKEKLVDEFETTPPWRRLGKDAPTTNSMPASPWSFGAKPKSMAKSPGFCILEYTLAGTKAKAMARPPQRRLVTEDNVAQELLTTLTEGSLRDIRQALQNDAALCGFVGDKVLQPLAEKVAFPQEPPLEVNLLSIIANVDAVSNEPTGRRPMLEAYGRAVSLNPGVFASVEPVGFFDSNATSFTKFQDTVAKRSVLVESVLSSPTSCPPHNPTVNPSAFATAPSPGFFDADAGVLSSARQLVLERKRLSLTVLQVLAEPPATTEPPPNPSLDLGDVIVFELFDEVGCATGDDDTEPEDCLEDPDPETMDASASLPEAKKARREGDFEASRVVAGAKGDD